jgi:phosphatidylglycerol:prolipoprotein diacylglycerol transferase
MYPILFQVNGLTIHTYGLFIAAGFLLGLAIAMKEARREGMDPQMILDLGFYLIFSAIVGARLFYVLQNPLYYLNDPLEIIKVWHGGLVFYGGFFLALIVCIFYLKRHRLPLAKTCDLFAPSLAAGEFLGRLGCFFAGCCYGKETNLPWGVTFTNPESLARVGVPLHPTQIYSSLLALLTFFILLYLKRHKSFEGEIAWFYILLYSIARLVVEYFRGDQRGFIMDETISLAQGIALIMGILSAFMLFYLRKKPGN